jgi:hypothetical protein
VNGNAAHLVTDHFALPCMQPGANQYLSNQYLSNLCIFRALSNGAPAAAASRAYLSLTLSSRLLTPEVISRPFAALA